ncbi:MAG TPA: DUF5666 domain-containing protein [Candidatus Angelobacter sp.]
MKKILAIPAVILLFAFLAFAHGNEEHVIGTVASVSPNSITVHTLKNENKEVAITGKTTFEGQNGPAKWEDVKVGDRVVIHADKDGNKLIAHTVRFSTAQPAAAH